MSTPSSEEGSSMVGNSATSSSLESARCLPSDSSGFHTEITPPSSPGPYEGKMPTPRDILDASRRLGQISALAVQGGMMPAKPANQRCHRSPSETVTNDEAGYDADGDGDGSGSEDVRGGAGTAETTKPIQRPGFLRIDTRQHRRVASMLAIRRPSPSFRDIDVVISPPPRVKFAPLTSIRLKPTTTTATTESYELRRRPLQRAELVGLGIGFPESHPLRGRAFTAPVPAAVSPIDDPGLPGKGLEDMQERQFEWLPSSTWLKKPMQTGVGICAPSPVRLALRPTFLEVSPSPIEYLPPVAGAGAGKLHYADVHERSEVMERDHGNRRTMGMFRHDAESVVMLPASSEVTMTVHVGSQSALLSRAAP